MGSVCTCEKGNDNLQQETINQDLLRLEEQKKEESRNLISKWIVYSLHRKTRKLIQSFIAEKVKNFINAKETSEVVFTDGTTNGMNMIVFGFFKDYLKKNDDIYIIKTDSAFEKFQYQQNYKGSELENIYSNMQVLNVPNIIQHNTISTQNYMLTGQSPVNKASTTVGTCYLPSAAECGITTAVLNN